jgi:UDP-N-acetylmuramyl pentapeptide phosphotransferase/UDP-N-acetylglucosamine-1-phosphate transferase
MFIFTQGAATFLGSAALSFALGFLVYRALARRAIVDKPNARSSHTDPTVRGGGIAIITVTIAGALVIGVNSHEPVLIVMAGASLLLSVVSFLDDLHPLPPLIRFGCHAICTLAAIAVLHGAPRSLELAPGHALPIAPLFGALVSFFWIAGYTNAFNFMDGINGIAAGQAAITGAGTGLLVALSTGNWLGSPVLFCFCLAGAAVGFLPHNFPRARMFMGDVSSAPLGFLLAVLVIWLSDKHADLLIPLGLLHTNFILDTAVTLIRRIVKGERWYESHREHFYQRLTRAGKTHSFVTCWEMALQCVTLFLMTIYLSSPEMIRVVLICAVIAMWTAFLGYCEFRFRGQINQSGFSAD